MTIGNLIGGGAFGCSGFAAALGEPSPRAIDRIAGEMGSPLFLLDLRRAPAPVATWLNQQHELGDGPGTLRLNLGRAFDVLFYLDTVTAACPR